MTPEELLHDAECSLKFRRLDVALAAATELVDTAPDANAYILRSRVLQQLERPAEAYGAIQDALGQFPGDELTLRAQEAMSLYRMRKADEAIAAADRVLELDPANEWAWKAKAGTLRMLRNDYKGARKTLEDALQKVPKSAILKAEYAVALARDAEEEKALLQADEALTDDPLSELALQTKTLLLIRKRKRDEAVQVLKTALVKNDSNAFVVNLLAQQALERGDVAEAITFAKRARELTPASETALQFLVRAHLLDDHADEAMALVVQAHAAQPAQLTPVRLLVELQMDAGDFDAAKQTLTKLEQLFPDNPATLNLRIDFLRRCGDVGSAIYAGHQAIQRLPSSSTVLMRVALACATQRRFAEAHRLLNEAPVNDSITRRTRVLLHIVEGGFAEAYAAIEEAVVKYPDEYQFSCFKAWLLANRGSFEEAHELIDDVLQEAPTDPLPYVVKLDALIMQLRLDDAVQLADHVLPRFRNAHDVNITAAQAYLQNGRPKDALACVRHVLKIDRSSTVAMQIESMALLALNKDREAFDSAQHGLEKFRRSTGLLAQRGYVYLKGFDDSENAERDFAKAAHQNPGALLAKTCLGQIAYGRRDYRKAQEWFRVVAEAQPHSAAAHTNLAWSYTATGEEADLELAENACQAALAIDEKHARAIGCLGAVAFRRKQRARAESLLADAVRHAPNDIELAVNLGSLQSRMGKYDAAEQTLRAALELGADHVRCLVELSQLAAKLGKVSEAKVFARRAIDADAASPEGWRAMAATLAAEQNLSEAEQALRQALARVDEEDSVPVRLDLARVLLMSSGSSPADVRHRDALEHIAVVISRSNRAEAHVLQAIAQLKLGAYDEARKTLDNVPVQPSMEPHVKSLQQVVKAYVATERRGIEPRLRTSMFALVLTTIVGIFAYRSLGQLSDSSFAVLLPLLLGVCIIILALPQLTSFKLGSTLEAQLAIPTREQRHELVAGPSLDLDMPPTAQLVGGTLSFDN